MEKIYCSVIFSLTSSPFSYSGFLDRESLSELSNGNLWSTETDATKALVGCYDALQSEDSLGFCWPGGKTCSLRELGFTTDNGYLAWIPWAGPDVITNNTMSPTSAVTKAVWNVSCAGIARCNNVIEKVPQILEAGKISKEAGTRIVCEAKFIKALSYNYLTSLYCDVSKIFNVLTTETSQVSRLPKSEIIADIVKDLKDITAEGMLPITADRRCATRGAALGLLTRVYLYNKIYKEVTDAAAQVMSLGYIIDPNYSTLFTEASGTSKEIIFTIRFKNTGQQNGKGGFLTHNYGYPMGWQLPYPNLANGFYCKNGKPITSSEIYDPNNDSTRDPCLTYTLMTKNSDMYDGKASDA